MINEKAWVPVGPDGDVWWHCVMKVRNDAIDELRTSSAMDATWKQLYREGWRIKRVGVIE